MGCQCTDLHSRMFMLHFKEDMLTTEIVSTMSLFSEPDEIFPLVLSLKEEGNKLVKLGKFDQAFSVYTKAVSFLVLGLPCCSGEFHPFKDLAIPLNLNIAMCALKLSNFRWVKSLCDCILHFEPTNVKALFRRAMAASNLGWLVAAKNDLTVARKIEPNNGDVLREWNKVTLLLDNTTRDDNCSSSCANMDIDSTNVAPATNKEARKLDFNPLKLPPKRVSNLVDRTGSECVDSIVTGVCSNNLGGKKAKLTEVPNDPPRVNCVPEDSKSDLGSSIPPLKPNMAEPKRFLNRSRPGSILNLSPQDYKKLESGRVLHYLYPHSSSFMSVRVKSSTSNPITSLKTQISDSSSVVNPDVVEVVEDNFTDILYGNCEKACDSNDSCSNSRVYLTSQSSTAVSLASSNTLEQISNKPVKGTSGLGIPSIITRHPFVPNFNWSVGKRRSRRTAKRAVPKRVKPVLGMKRKSISNTFISCYPKWKKMVPYDLEDKTYDVGANGQISHSPSTSHKAISWVENTLAHPLHDHHKYR